MKRNLYNDVLNRLFKNGVGYETDISDLFTDFAKDADLPTVYWTERKDLIQEYLESMKQAKHVLHFKVNLLPKPENQINKHWLDPIEVKAGITHTGCDYIVRMNQFDISLAQLDTAKKSFKSVRFWTWVAIVLSALSLSKDFILAKTKQYQSHTAQLERQQHINKAK